MNFFKLAFLSLLWTVPWTPSSPPPTNTAFITGMNFTGTTRNDFTGYVGMYFTAPVTGTIKELGRWVVSGNSDSHILTVVAPDGVTQLGSGIVNTSGQPAGAFAYVTITPISITAGQTYTLASSETNGFDTWWDFGGTVPSGVSGGAVLGAVFYTTLPATQISGSEIFVPVNFKY